MTASGIIAKYTSYIVTGAPGSGKSTALDAFVRLHSAYIAFDIDWLTITASGLAGKDIIFDQSTWKAYNAVWFEILHAIHVNGKVPVLFAPLDVQDIQKYGQPAWCASIEWCLLDCDDALRRKRLLQRPGWTETMVEEAIEDAQFLRATIHRTIDTGTLPPLNVASEILRWLQGVG